MALEKVPYREQCDRGASGDDGQELCCWLRAGHDGPHYDEMDDVSWQVNVTPGVPAEVKS
jgi:hypothetical protein